MSFLNNNMEDGHSENNTGIRLSKTDTLHQLVDQTRVSRHREWIDQDMSEDEKEDNSYH